MKLYHVSQTVRNGYDTFSDMVVCAESEEEAKLIHPYWPEDWHGTNFYKCWCDDADDVTAKYLGEADETIAKGVVCASFHAG